MISVIILAAGRSTRMKSQTSKVLHKIAGQTMISYVINAVNILEPLEIIIVTSAENEDIKKHVHSINPDIKIAIQDKQIGTANAVKAGINISDFKNNYFLILYADSPLIEADILQKFISDAQKNKANISVIGSDYKTPNGYGRFIIDSGNLLKEIIEYKDANDEERNITICNSGIMLIEKSHIYLIDFIENNNQAKEFYLTDLVKIANNKNSKVIYFLVDEIYTQGANDRYELSLLENIIQNKLRKKIMNQGVTLIAPETVFLSQNVECEPDVIIHPNVYISGNVHIKSGTEIRAFSHIEGDVQIGNKCVIGPYARIRTGTNLADNVHIGSFVEIKNSNISSHTKANHLSYIGDSEIGENVNIGAGAITCNYDGIKKHKTKIGNNVFIGTNASLIAPLIIEDNSFVAAGSVINKNIPPNTLAISRSQQINKNKKLK